ncbi:hypothetical protein CUC46_24180 (plasmid) [Citrobacter freundii]|nr:hypothetical protein CUC46_24180 [Citrobacter freundii]
MAPSYSGCKKYTIHVIHIIHTIQLIHTVQNLHTLFPFSRSDPKTPSVGKRTFPGAGSGDLH